MSSGKTVARPPGSAARWAVGGVDVADKDCTIFIIVPNGKHHWRAYSHGCWQVSNAQVEPRERGQTAQWPCCSALLRHTCLRTSVTRSAVPQRLGGAGVESRPSQNPHANAAFSWVYDSCLWFFQLLSVSLRLFSDLSSWSNSSRSWLGPVSSSSVSAHANVHFAHAPSVSPPGARWGTPTARQQRRKARRTESQGPTLRMSVPRVARQGVNPGKGADALRRPPATSHQVHRCWQPVEARPSTFLTRASNVGPWNCSSRQTRPLPTCGAVGLVSARRNEKRRAVVGLFCAGLFFLAWAHHEDPFDRTASLSRNQFRRPN